MDAITMSKDVRKLVLEKKTAPIISEPRPAAATAPIKPLPTEPCTDCDSDQPCTDCETTPKPQKMETGGTTYFPITVELPDNSTPQPTTPRMSEEDKRRLTTYVAGGVLLLLILALVFTKKSA